MTMGCLMAERELSAKLKRLGHEYFKDFNPAAAARRAGYSEGYARVDVYKALANPSMQKYLCELAGQLIDSTDITPEEVIRGYVRIARADMRHYMTWGANGMTLFPSETLSDAQAYAVSEVSETVSISPAGTETRKVKFKLESKAHAQDALAKYFDLWKEGEKAKAVAEAFGQGMLGLIKAQENGPR
jgi:phage terminase small subunit